MLPTFPVQRLPKALRDFALAQATATQVPIDLPAMVALGAAAAVVAGRYDIEIAPGYVEGLNLYLAIGMDTGARKSPSFNAAFEPLRAAERIAVDGARTSIAQAKIRRETTQKKIARKQSELVGLSRDDQKTERPQVLAPGKLGGLGIEKELDALAERLDREPVPAVPCLIVEDVTPEALAQILGEQSGRLCLASDEGGIFSVMAGRYAKDGQGSFDVFLKAYSGTEIRVNRKSSDSPPVFVRRPRLCITLCVQPSVIGRIMANEAMRSQGLIARFLFAVPASNLGMRDVDAAEPIETDVLDRYHELVFTPLRRPAPKDDEPIPRVKLSPEARAMHLALQREIEPRLHPATGDLAPLGDWVAKFAGNVARIAGVLHCHTTTDPTSKPVSGVTMDRAVEIGRYLLAHACHVYGVLGDRPEAADADVLLEWLGRTRPPGVKMRDIRRTAPRGIRAWPRPRLLDGMQELVDRGIATKVSQNAQNWAVVPEAWMLHFDDGD